ncbi:hypothetical protein AcV7_007629 [Taiwanofungus camphoratus]|nr:hypothetical protein AcV7_007629 [Antrodia cinnamomea]
MPETRVPTAAGGALCTNQIPVDDLENPDSDAYRSMFRFVVPSLARVVPCRILGVNVLTRTQLGCKGAYVVGFKESVQGFEGAGARPCILSEPEPSRKARTPSPQNSLTIASCRITR